VQYPPRKVQSASYTGPITISGYEKYEWMREELKKRGVNLSLPTGNYPVISLVKQKPRL
jgi:hypothetical protein